MKKHDPIKMPPLVHYLAKIAAISLLAIVLNMAQSILLMNDPLLAQRTKSSQKSGEQRKAEKGLSDNRYFFYFINASITNFSDEDDKKIFREAVQRNIIAQLLYMRFMFFESFTEIQKAQMILIRLYQKSLNNTVQSLKDLLNGFAPMVIRSKDESALAYLHLGYRDMKVAQTHQGMADNYKSNLYSMRLYEYIHAIKNAKHGRHYAFLSIITAQDIAALYRERTRYESFEFRQKIVETKQRIKKLGFNEIGKRLLEIPPRENVDYYQLIHRDNYYKCAKDECYYDFVWQHMNLNEIKELKRYLGSE